VCILRRDLKALSTLLRLSGATRLQIFSNFMHARRRILNRGIVQILFSITFETIFFGSSVVQVQSRYVVSVLISLAEMTLLTVATFRAFSMF
jgi:hypothetical protein